jgi:hypothetical protein
VCYEPAGLFTGLTCTNTDANGFYQLTLSPGPYSLSIFGFTPGASEVSIGQSVTVPSAPTLIQLAPTQPVAVRIVNTDGTPLAGAQLFSLCGTAPAVIGGTERFCAEPPASDAAGAVTVLTPIGSPLQLQIESSSISAPLAIDAVPVGDHTEVTIAVQSAASP